MTEEDREWADKVFGEGNWIHHECPSVKGKKAIHHKNRHGVDK